MADKVLSHEEPAGEDRDLQRSLDSELWDTISAESSVDELLDWQIAQANRYCAG